MEETTALSVIETEEEYYGEYQSECVFDEIPPDDAFADDEISEALQAIEFCNYYSGKLWQINPKGDVPVADFLPVPIEDIVYDDGAEQSRFFKIKGLKKIKGEVIELPAIIIRAEDCASMNWVTANWGFDANIFSPLQTRKDTLRSIMFMVGQKKAVQKTIYTHTGWRENNGSWFYLHGGGAIGKENVEVHLDNKLSAFDLSGEKHNFISVSDAVCDFMRVSKPEVMYPIAATLFLSPLNEFLKQAGYEPLFVLFLLGRTQSRKSTLAALALSFFGKFTASALPSSFKDTANAIEKKGYLLKDMLMVVDDYHPVSDSYIRKNMEQIMQSIVRGYGDRTGRDRMNTDIKLRGGYAPRGNIIVTGEDFPNIGQSGAARSFIVELMPSDVPVSDYLNKAQHYAAEGYFTDFMREYINWLIPQTDELPKKLKQKFLDYRRDALDGNFSGLGRTGDNVAWLMIGFEYFSKFLCYSHIISEEEQKLFLQQAWEVFTNLALKQIEKSVEETPTQMFVSAIRDLFETQKISTQSIGCFPESLS